jgi:hypothetical protein
VCGLLWVLGGVGEYYVCVKVVTNSSKFVVMYALGVMELLWIRKLWELLCAYPWAVSDMVL